MERLSKEKSPQYGANNTGLSRITGARCGEKTAFSEFAWTAQAPRRHHSELARSTDFPHTQLFNQLQMHNLRK
jgi:hypothetical protein